MIRLVKMTTMTGDSGDLIGDDDNWRWLVGIEDLDSSEKPLGKNLTKYLIVGGGAIVLACTLDRRLLTKVMIFNFDGDENFIVLLVSAKLTNLKNNKIIKKK
ncbi:hypothetical protein ACH5RR_017953 [Cinchona calisaya]|uniref:Uncharacterized protein n=1 Tax=Cinchona calisaya TaxID=153742 RepID=A0ABD2ZKQ7_9GENT